MEILRKEFRLFSILIEVCNPVLNLCYFLWPQYAKADNVLLTSPFILLYFIYLVVPDLCVGLQDLIP